MRPLNKKARYFLIVAVILAPLLFAYFHGPASRLTLLSKLHYNTLFVFTPCMGAAKTYDDGHIRFSYTQPPSLLNHAAVFFMDPRTAWTDLGNTTDVSDLDIVFKPSYKFRPTDGAAPAGGPGWRLVRLKSGTGAIKTDGLYGGFGPEYLQVAAKNGYTYRLALPIYPERMTDRSWLFPALYHSGLLSFIMPGSFSDLLPPRGFFAWFFTPCADKQLYCSANTAISSLEVVE